MGMVLDVGGYPFPLNSVEVSREWETLMSPQRRPYGEKHRWSVRGQFIAAGPSVLIALGNQAETALRRQFQDIVFRTDTGQIIYQLRNAPSTDGVKVTRYANPPQPGLLATILPFEFMAEASYPYAGIGVVVLEMRESLTVSGGGPRYVFTECVNADPVKFMTASRTVSRATQSGSMRTIGGRGTFPQPIFLSDLLPGETEQGEDKGLNSDGIMEYNITWRYQFATGGLLTL